MRLFLVHSRSRFERILARERFQDFFGLICEDEKNVHDVWIYLFSVARVYQYYSIVNGN